MVIYFFAVFVGLRMMKSLFNLILFSFVEIKVSVTGLSKFKEGVSKI